MKAPETDALIPQQVAGAGGDLRGAADITSPCLAKGGVRFEVASIEEIENAWKAFEVLKDKAFNQMPGGVPGGAGCEQS